MAQRYNVEVGALEFVPVGIDSWAYTVRDRTGNPRLFLKLFAGSTSYVGLPRGAELPLMTALADLGRVGVPRPVADVDGGFIDRFDRFELCALEYVEGKSLEDETVWPDELFGRVAETLGAIHSSTRAVRDFVPRKESFELPFARSLLGNVERVERLGSSRWSRTSRELKQLADLLAPQAAGTRRAIGTLGKLRMVAAGRQPHAVLAHSDFWGSNLLMAPDGRLFVVDWDGAMLAPAEADLFMLAGTPSFPPDRFGWFLDAYELAFQPMRVDADVLAFYLYRRTLEDLAAFVADVVDERADAMPLGDTLGVIRNLVDELPRLETRTAALRDLLGGRVDEARGQESALGWRGG